MIRKQGMLVKNANYSSSLVTLFKVDASGIVLCTFDQTSYIARLSHAKDYYLKKL